MHAGLLKPINYTFGKRYPQYLSKHPLPFLSQEMNCDWFDFWLNGHEDPDPAKLKQYERWKALKAH